MKYTNIAITGGAGFIGSHVTESLIHPDNKILVLDTLRSGDINNIKTFIDNGSINFLKEDIRDYHTLESLFNEFEIEIVFHLAAQVSVPLSLHDPVLTHDINVNGTYNILEASRKTNVEKIVFSSSCAVYGNADSNNPIKETNELQSLNSYSLSKNIGEKYCQLYSSNYGLSCSSLRYFNVYGPRQDPNGDYAAVIPKFITNLLNQQSPIIYGDGTQTRDFIYVGDVIKANMIAAENDKTGIYNIASGKQTSINDIAMILIDKIDKNIKPIHAEPRSSEIIFQLLIR